jgi:cell division protein FtsW
MARLRRSQERAGALEGALEGAAGVAPRGHQTTTSEAPGLRVTEVDASALAVKLLCIVLVLMALGLLLQAAHAATISTSQDFAGEVRQQAKLRMIGLAVLLVGYWLGPAGLRRHLPWLALAAAVLLLLLWIPPFSKPENGSFRWIRLFPTRLSFQPSELARILMVLWAADRCVRLGPRVRELRRGMLPLLGVGLFFVALIGLEPDLGGAVLFLSCFLGVACAGGVRIRHAAGAGALIVAVALTLAYSQLGYIRSRLAVFVGDGQNEQVNQSISALGSGKLFGVGIGQGLYRNQAMPYQDSDYIFSLVGEEFGLFGVALVLGLLLAFVLYAMRLVLALRDRYLALSAFGLLLSVCLQAMVHVAVVTRLVPPKGMTLPFLSDGGTSMVVSSLAVGLALGAARPAREKAPKPLSIPLPRTSH